MAKFDDAYCAACGSDAPSRTTANVSLSGEELECAPCTLLFYADRGEANPVAVFWTEQTARTYAGRVGKAEWRAFSTVPALLYYPASLSLSTRECYESWGT